MSLSISASAAERGISPIDDDVCVTRTAWSSDETALSDKHLGRLEAEMPVGRQHSAVQALTQGCAADLWPINQPWHGAVVQAALPGLGKFGAT